MTSVTPGHDDEALDCPGLYRVHDLVGQCQDLVMGETCHQCTPLDLNRRIARLRQFYDGGKILCPALRPVSNMCNAGIARHTRCKDPVFVRILDGNNTVGCQENRAFEGREFRPLFPPGAPVVACKMGVLFKCGIRIGREHFTMGVYIHSGPFGLFQEFLHILEIVTGDQDPGIGSDTDIDR